MTPREAHQGTTAPSRKGEVVTGGNGNGHGSALPGEAEADGALLDRAVAELNRIHVAQSLELAKQLGQYVLDTFFDGDFERFRNRGRRHATFRALAERDDLHVAFNTLWYAVAVLDQLRELPSDVAEALPVSHHKALLPLHDRETKEQLAREAAEKRLTVRDLDERVRQAREGGNGSETAEGKGPGRPPLPAFVKGVTRLRKAVEVATSEDVDERSLERYDPAEARRVAEELDEHLQRLAELKSKVLAAADAREKDGSSGSANASSSADSSSSAEAG